MLLIKNCEIIDVLIDYPQKADVLVENGVIKAISQDIYADADMIINAEGLKLLPGLIDLHTHLREPGFEYKETIKTGTRAAAKGGYTGVCCMSNTKPVIDDTEKLEFLQEIIKKDAIVDVYPIASITMGQMGEELTDFRKLMACGTIGFSDDGNAVADINMMYKAMLLAKAAGALIIEHCEDLVLVDGGVVNKGIASDTLGIKGISNLSEEMPIMRNIILAELTGARLHIAHVSTKNSIEIIKQAKAKNINISCEATPHHIALTDEIIKKGFTDCKVNPPLRSSEDVAAVKKALRDGTIDIIATDHAPHSITDKGEDFYRAAFGISGIETAFSICYTELVESGLITLRELVNKMSYNPAKLIGINKGRIIEGADADFVLIDTEKNIEINRNSFISLGKNTPFHGEKYKGEIVYTIKSGKLVYGGNYDNR